MPGVKMTTAEHFEHLANLIERSPQYFGMGPSYAQPGERAAFYRLVAAAERRRVHLVKNGEVVSADATQL